MGVFLRGAELDTGVEKGDEAKYWAPRLCTYVFSRTGGEDRNDVDLLTSRKQDQFTLPEN